MTQRLEGQSKFNSPELQSSKLSLVKSDYNISVKKYYQDTSLNLTLKFSTKLITRLNYEQASVVV
ncbi:hypothetical protein BpHYR1_025454 [Brachionus plicatilis]|uniref:Uncharacterized protein n=1 Tax=Brachionus plicatilis TaxID=10195 RepID=A0A3M7Q0U6_BRAPC|nr:hypothetical protein BpHYR1_025454 [Brachionus plicatilis]